VANFSSSQYGIERTGSNDDAGRSYRLIGRLQHGTQRSLPRPQARIIATEDNQDGAAMIGHALAIEFCTSFLDSRRQINGPRAAHVGPAQGDAKPHSGLTQGGS